MREKREDNIQMKLKDSFILYVGRTASSTFHKLTLILKLRILMLKGKQKVKSIPVTGREGP
jgi:hypothetical protein